MRASRLLPSAAFAVAVGFFFVPPVISLAGLMPAFHRPQPRLEIVPSEASSAIPSRTLRHTAMLQRETCSPARVPGGGAAKSRSVLALADPVR